jgi:hypothetical protein
LMHQLNTKCHHFSELLHITQGWSCSYFWMSDLGILLCIYLLHKWCIFIERIEINWSPRFFRRTGFSVWMMTLSSICTILAFLLKDWWVLGLH